jgi:type III restriction enzyme
LILETKGFDELESIKKAAAERWINAVNVDQRFGYWKYAVAKKPEEVRKCLDNARKR